jgi:hypothetical protein
VLITEVMTTEMITIAIAVMRATVMQTTMNDTFIECIIVHSSNTIVSSDQHHNHIHFTVSFGTFRCRISYLISQPIMSGIG